MRPSKKYCGDFYFRKSPFDQGHYIPVSLILIGSYRNYVGKATAIKPYISAIFALKIDAYPSLFVIE